MGHQVQVLTSDHRLPPMGLPSSTGVFRKLRLFTEPRADPLLGHSYRVTLAHERYNADILESRVRRFKPDAVYVWNMEGLSKSLLFRLQNKGLRVVYDLHSDWLLPANFNRDPWYRWWFANSSKRSEIYRTLLSSIGRVRRVMGMLPIGAVDSLDLSASYVVSDWLRGHLSENGLSVAKSLPRIYPALDLNKLSPKKSFRRRRRFVWAGRLNAFKGADIAVDAIGILKERGIDVSLDLFGMGKPSERKAKRQRIEAVGLMDRVTMRGIRSGEMAEHYAHYDALLYTSRCAEPFSMTVLEAMLSNVPCIVANIGGNQELLEHAKNALLFEAGDAHSLADAVAEFMQLEDGGRNLAECSIQRLQVEQAVDAFCRHIEPFLASQP